MKTDFYLYFYGNLSVVFLANKIGINFSIKILVLFISTEAVQMIVNSNLQKRVDVNVIFIVSSYHSAKFDHLQLDFFVVFGQAAEKLAETGDVEGK